MEASLKNEILSLHREGNAAVKQFLINRYGEDVFKSSTTWMELWQKFCKDHELDLTLPYPTPANPDEEYIDAHFMIMHIIRKKRKKKPDFNNSNETKYNPVFDMRSTSGFAFSYSLCDYWSAYSDVGSRLCIPSDRALMEQLAVEFLPIYEKIMIEP